VASQCGAMLPAMSGEAKVMPKNDAIPAPQRASREAEITRASQKAADLAPVRFSSPNGGILETKELNLSRLHSGPYFMRYSSMALLVLSGPDTTSVPSGANQRKQVIPLSSNSITYSRSFMRLTPSFSFDRIFTIAGERRARFEKVVHRANSARKAPVRHCSPMFIHENVSGP
jgi:hypothetical protein